MRFDTAIFQKTSLVPPPARGLAITARLDADGRGAWLHGALHVPEGEEADAAAAVASVVVVTVPKSTCVAHAAPVARAGALQSAPPWRLREAGGEDAKGVRFALHTSWIGARVVPGEPLWVHLCRGRDTSAPVRVTAGDAPEAPKKAPTGDVLIAAYDHAREERWAAAFELFRTALREPAAAADLDGAHRYNAACAAVRAAASASGEIAQALENEALSLLREDLLARVVRHTKLVAARAFSGEVGAIDEALVRHVAALRADADLAPIRANGRLEEALREVLAGPERPLADLEDD